MHVDSCSFLSCLCSTGACLKISSWQLWANPFEVYYANLNLSEINHCLAPILRHSNPYKKTKRQRIVFFQFRKQIEIIWINSQTCPQMGQHVHLLRPCLRDGNVHRARPLSGQGCYHSNRNSNIPVFKFGLPAHFATQWVKSHVCVRFPAQNEAKQILMYTLMYTLITYTLMYIH